MFEANEERYIHLTPEEVSQLKRAIQNNQKWLDDVRHAMLSWNQYDNPSVTCADIESHRKQFESEVHPIMHKPVPKKGASPPEPNPAGENAQASADANQPPSDQQSNIDPTQQTNNDQNQNNPMEFE